MFPLSQWWQAHNNGGTRAVRVSPQDKRRTEDRYQQKIKAGSHTLQVHLWSWWILKRFVHFFFYYLPIICANYIRACIWIINILRSASLLSACWPRAFWVIQCLHSNPSLARSSYPVCLRRRSPQIKCVWGPAWSARTSPPCRSQMMTAASLQTHRTSCTIDGEERNTWGEW